MTRQVDTLHVEPVRLDETLRGAVALLVDVLAMTDPAAYGRAHRVQARVHELAASIGLVSTWQVEMAAMLQPIATITLPHETARRLHQHEPLSPEEQRMVAQLPTVTDHLLAHLPHLEEVRAILVTAAHPTAADGTLVELSAALLRVAGDLEDLAHGQLSEVDAAAEIAARTGHYPARVVALVGHLAGLDRPICVEEVPLHGLRAGMTFAEDVRLSSGVLLVSRGYVVTPAFLARLRNFPDGAVRSPVRVAVRA